MALFNWKNKAVIGYEDNESISTMPSIQSTELNSNTNSEDRAVKDFRNPIIDFDRNNTYIQSEGINQDFGIYDCPDDLLKERHQEISLVKAFAYRNLGRYLMNRNVNIIRNSK